MTRLIATAALLALLATGCSTSTRERIRERVRERVREVVRDAIDRAAEKVTERGPDVVAELRARALEEVDVILAAEPAEEEED